MSKVSVIVPFYKGNEYMDRLYSSIESNKEYLVNKKIDISIELIIVNDSPGVTIKLPQDVYGLEYKIINHLDNMGIHQARVTGLEKCSGDYIVFLDQDDEIKENFIGSQITKIGNADVIICNALLEQSDGTHTFLYRNQYEFEKVQKLITYIKSHNQIASPGQCIIRKSAIPKEWYTYIMKTNGSDDLFLWLLMLYKNRKFCLNPECLYIHKYTGQNLSASSQKMSCSSLEVLQYLENIEYVNKKDLVTFKKAREIGKYWNNYNLFQKIIVIWKNKEIYMSRICWKMSSIVFNLRESFKKL